MMSASLGVFEGKKPWRRSRPAIRWGFFRNNRQCGTFNARPYILSGGGRPDRETPTPDAEEVFGTPTPEE